MNFPSGFSRFIFDLDLTLLQSKINEGIISTGCTTGMTHTLRMTNSSHFDTELLNTKDSLGRKRATSFDLMLFRIPEISTCTTTSTTPEPDPCDPIIYPSTATTVCQSDRGMARWDEGVGYDHAKLNTADWEHGGLFPFHPPQDKAYSTEPSNWLWRTKLERWSEPGIYNNQNMGVINYNTPNTGITGSSVIHIVDIQHFEFGNEDIEFDMTDEVNNILNGSLTGCSGWGIAFLPQYELMTGITNSYSVGFFSKHTNTFYEPFLETKYDDLILDDREYFTELRENKLYLYLYEDGDFMVLDNPPKVRIEPANSFTGFTGTSCMITKGVYEIKLPKIEGLIGQCMTSETWFDMFNNGIQIPDITNDLIIKPYGERMVIGTESISPDDFAFDFYGIEHDEKLCNVDVRKVTLTVRKAFEKRVYNKPLNILYKIYVREGNTQVIVQDWTLFNRTPNEYYFIFDTRDKIPNEYWVDIKIHNSGKRELYSRKLKFQIVSFK